MAKPSEIHKPASIVACIWDFDKTLISGYMQSEMLKEYGIDENHFWDYINSMPSILEDRGYKLTDTLSYLNFLISAVRLGYFPGLTRDKLIEYGKSLKFFPGILDFIRNTKEEMANDEKFQNAGILLEHYIVSSGNAETIGGSLIAEYVDGIFATSFLGEEIDDVVNEFFQKYSSIVPNNDKSSISIDAQKRTGLEFISNLVDSTHKTRCIFEINKGCNKNPLLNINTAISDDQRRVPFQNMIYIADGPSDIPAFSLLKERGGKTFAVYNQSNDQEFEQVDRMLQDNRVHAYGPTDYTDSSVTAKWIRMHIKKIAERIVDDNEHITRNRLGKHPTHLH